MKPPGALFFLMMALACVLLGDSSEGGRLYRWVDEQGVVHFSDRPPDGKDKLKGSVEEMELRETLPLTEGKGQESKPGVQGRNPIDYAMNCAFTLKGPRNVGTGFFISTTGYAVTCRHVIEGGLPYSALLHDQREFPVAVLSLSQKSDLALIQVLIPQEMPYLSPRNPETLVPGERLFAVGTSAGLQSTVTDGVFTGLRRITPSEEKVLQFSAPINQGNSGGPLIDDKGKVVGIVSLKYVMSRGMPVSGVGFAVPVHLLVEEYGAYMDRAN